MQEKVIIPFMAEFEYPMLTGEKTATTQTKRYGYPDDYFEKFGRLFVLTDVYRVDLGSVAHFHYCEEGFNCAKEFINIWIKLHPRCKYKPDQMVYFHKFILMTESIPPFHVHELMEDVRCRICGCDPTPMIEDDAKKHPQKQGVVYLQSQA